MQLPFHQSYAFNGTKNFHYFHPIRPTQIEMKGILSCWHLFFSCTNFNQLSSQTHIFKKEIVAAVYEKTWYTSIVQNVDQEHVDASIQFMHLMDFLLFVLVTRR